jgi:hypothetical protein
MKYQCPGCGEMIPEGHRPCGPNRSLKAYREMKKQRKLQAIRGKVTQLKIDLQSPCPTCGVPWTVNKTECSAPMYCQPCEQCRKCRHHGGVPDWLKE